MQMGAFLAGTAIENSMLGVCHACANPLTAHYGITHGLAIGIMLPHVIGFNACTVGALYGDLAQEAGLANGTPEAAAQALAERLVALMRLGRLAHDADLVRRLARHPPGPGRGSRPANGLPASTPGR